MKISNKGLDLIKLAEGYHQKQKDGSCKAYLCPAGVPTCGWGSTVGVTLHTHWTVEEAADALRQEMATHETSVMKMVKVPLNQHQFDALVSLSYNIGATRLKKSTLLRHLNDGDYARAASHFADFKYAKVSGDTARLYRVKDGTSVALAGLVTRRAAEAQLFLESAPIEPMPQKIEAPTPKMTTGEVAAKVAVPATAASGGIATAVQAPPDLSNLTAWKGVAEQGKDLATWAVTNWPWSVGAGGLYLLLAHGLPYWQKRRA